MSTCACCCLNCACALQPVESRPSCSARPRREHRRLLRLQFLSAASGSACSGPAARVELLSASFFICVLAGLAELGLVDDACMFDEADLRRPGTARGAARRLSGGCGAGGGEAARVCAVAAAASGSAAAASAPAARTGHRAAAPSGERSRHRVIGFSTLSSMHDRPDHWSDCPVAGPRPATRRSDRIRRRAASPAQRPSVRIASDGAGLDETSARLTGRTGTTESTFKEKACADRLSARSRCLVVAGPVGRLRRQHARIPTTPTAPSGRSPTETFEGTLNKNGAATFTVRRPSSGTVTATLVTDRAGCDRRPSASAWAPGTARPAPRPASSTTTRSPAPPSSARSARPRTLCVRVYDVGKVTDVVTFRSRSHIRSA